MENPRLQETMKELNHQVDRLEQVLQEKGYIISPYDTNQQQYWFEIDNDDYRPFLERGDMVCLDTKYELEVGAIYAFLIGSKGMIRRLEHVNFEIARLSHIENPRYQEEYRHDSKVVPKIIGRITSLRRKL